MIKKTIGLFLGVVLLSSCYQTAKIANQNLAYIYQKEAQVLHPHYSVYHHSPSKSQLNFSINTQELLYMKSPGSANYAAKVSVTFSLFASYESRQVLDSGTVFLEDDASKDEILALNGVIDINASYPNSYILEVIMTDLNRNQSSLAYVEVNKSGIHAPQNFSLTNPKNSQIIFGNRVVSNQSFTIGYDKNSAQKQLLVNYFKPNFSLPAPPFSVQNASALALKVDSTFRIVLDDKFKQVLSFQKEGVYQFQSDTTALDGFTLLVMNDDYPDLGTPEQLIPPLRYITTKQEYETLTNSQQKKLAVDNFWINNCGNTDRGRAAIKIFYNRVINANTYFTSYSEGWKTDRGLVYIAFGQPGSVYRDSRGETWYYGEEQNYKALTFTFSKVSNPYSDNDYVLNRTENYRSDWFRMIDAWRQCKIINNK